MGGLSLSSALSNGVWGPRPQRGPGAEPLAYPYPYPYAVTPAADPTNS